MQCHLDSSPACYPAGTCLFRIAVAAAELSRNIRYMLQYCDYLIYTDIKLIINTYNSGIYTRHHIQYTTEIYLLTSTERVGHHRQPLQHFLEHPVEVVVSRTAVVVAPTPHRQCVDSSRYVTQVLRDDLLAGVQLVNNNNINIILIIYK